MTSLEDFYRNREQAERAKQDRETKEQQEIWVKIINLLAPEKAEAYASERDVNYGYVWVHTGQKEVIAWSLALKGTEMDHGFALFQDGRIGRVQYDSIRPQHGQLTAFCQAEDLDSVDISYVASGIIERGPETPHSKMFHCCAPEYWNYPWAKEQREWAIKFLRAL